MSRRLIQGLGWYGVAAILIAYGLSVFGWLAPESATYFLLNITGSAGVVAVSLLQKNYQPAVLNIIWCIIGALGLIRYLLTP